MEVVLVGAGIHPVHGGSGYEYYMRETASADEVRAKGQGLTDYYLDSGNPPGRFLGSGCAELEVTGVVEEHHMRALFGEARHPEADRIEAELIAQGATPAEAQKATQLGGKLPEYSNPGDSFDREVKAAFASFKNEHGRVPSAGVEADQLRWDTAVTHLTQRSPGREITDQSVRAFFAVRGGHERQPVSGYDFTFSPVKSISVLWSLGDRETARAIEAAHHEAVTESMQWLEDRAAFTRVGKAGIAQVNTKGFVATAFDHADSRAGDPDLHTHVVVANRVQAFDGKWRALDGRVLYNYTVATSEQYNSLMMQKLTERLGVTWAPKDATSGKQPIYEIKGIPNDVLELFSQRGVEIKEVMNELVNEFYEKHGVMPSASTQKKLAQQATLVTRPSKEKGVTHGERRVQQRGRLAQHLGDETLVDDMMAAVIDPSLSRGSLTLTDEQRAIIAKEVVVSLEGSHARWNLPKIEAETERVTRGILMDVEAVDGMEYRYNLAVDSELFGTKVPFHEVANLDAETDAIARLVRNRECVSLTAPEIVEHPALLSQVDGSSQYRVNSATWYTSTRVLDREAAILRAGATVGGPVVDGRDIELVGRTLVNGRGLTDSQRDVAVRFGTRGKLFDAAVGPAGAGKTTAMRAFARGVEINGGRVIALATQATSAEIIGDELGLEAETIARFLYDQRQFDAIDAAKAAGTYEPTPWDTKRDHMRLDGQTFIVIDEIGKTNSSDLAAILAYAEREGAAVRGLGDYAQTGAIGGGGALRLFDREIGAAELTDVHRFADPREAEATLALRRGELDALDFYVDEGRVFMGTEDQMLEAMFVSWRDAENTPIAAGSDYTKVSVMTAEANEHVNLLNVRAQRERVQSGHVLALSDRTLSDGNRVGLGDRVLTRENDRQTRMADGRHVKNGYQWNVTGINDDGSLEVRHSDTGQALTLGSEYVDRAVQLGYASTISRVQGATTNGSNGLVKPGMSREALYTQLTRGTGDNNVFVVTDELLDVEGHHPRNEREAARMVLERVVGNEQQDVSATETLYNEFAESEAIDNLLAKYEDVLHRLGEPIDHQVARAIIDEHGGMYAAHIKDDKANWHTLARKVHDVTNAGGNIAERVRNGVQRGDILHDPEPALALAQTLGEAGPGGRVGHPELDSYLERLEDVIRIRLGDVDAKETIPADRNYGQLLEAWGVVRVDSADQAAPPQGRAKAEATLAKLKQSSKQLDSLPQPGSPAAGVLNTLSKSLEVVREDPKLGDRDEL